MAPILEDFKMARFNSCPAAPITTLAGISGLALVAHRVIVGFQPDNRFEAYKAVTLDGGSSFKAAYKRLAMAARLAGGWRVEPTFGGWHAERRAVVDGQPGWALITILN